MQGKTDLAQGIPEDAIAPGGMLAGMYEGEHVVLARLEDGRLRAVSGSCTHLGAPLETGKVSDGQLRCPWHHARFSLEDGEAVGGPALENLGCYRVEQSDGLIRVTGRRHTPAPRRELAVETPIVIIGSGAGGYAMADMLSRLGHGEDTLVLSAESDPPYERTFVSKQYLAGRQSRDEALLPAPGQGLGEPASIRLGTPVVSLDPATRSLTLESGETVSYGTLVLATGARAAMPDFPGAQDARVHTLRTLADADAILAQVQEGKRAVVLGASFIGLEVAASLTQQGLDVDVVAQDAAPLASILGEETGQYVRRLHEEHGVTFHMERTVTAFKHDAVWLDDTTRLPADLVIAGIGVLPRLDLALTGDLALCEASGGVRVDGNLRTSDPHVYAIGDIASYPDPRTGKPLRVEHWVHAQRMGQYLARAFTGAAQAPFAQTPFFWTGYFGTQMRYVGHAKPEASRLEGDPGADDFAVFFREKGEDRAVLTVGRDMLALQMEERWDAQDM
ncbi:FAD-dependent oxidoreductase [Novosphingobium profundi]|uniref:FAD-dependent oxidoreductase n=1 Tax=Novosphingobium profundi TaxID=1774954 RepID=UPI001BDA3876|nr:FAD-dependent oxidoreductase [Novosphingobium profundi]MBT0668636.1 FAD-dependent oxidoreductase [Novosphingobium profundi]